MTKSIIATDKAPKAIGPYSQAVRASGEVVFFSGQIALDPATQTMVQGGIEVETRRALDNVRGVVQAAGLTMNDIVKVTVFLTDLANFQKMNEVYGTYFEAQPPARSTVGVASLPRGALIEIECIAVK